MAFELIEKRTPTSDERRASVSLTLRSSAQRPAFRVTVYRALSEKLKWPTGSDIRLSIGTGEDEGLIMVSRSSISPIANFTVLKNGMAFIDFGSVEPITARYGKESRVRTDAEVTHIEADHFVARLPSPDQWLLKSVGDHDEAEDQDGAEDKDTTEQEEQETVAPIPAFLPAPPRERDAAQQAVACKPAAAEASVKKADPAVPRVIASKEGVTIKLNPPSLQYQQKTTPLSEGQAAFLAVVLMASPGCVLASEIARRGYALLGLAVSNNTETMVGYELRNVGAKVAAMKLKLVFTKGFGWTLSFE